MLHVLRDREPNIEVSLARLARQAILIDLSTYRRTVGCQTTFSLSFLLA
jgi:hypothetical protein